MINRTLIRLKIVQLVYAFYQNEGKTVETAEKELLFSLSKAYDLYNLLLLLIVTVTRYARKQVDEREKLNKAAHIDEPVNRRFVENRFAVQLEENLQLRQFVQNQKRTWDGEIVYVKSLYEKIIASELYAEYMKKEETTYAEDRELWRALYKNIVMKDESLDEVIEDQSLYWNDDREIVDTFILKTIKRFDESNGKDQELVPEYKDEEDREFAIRLFHRTITNDEYYRGLIIQSIRNWEFDRLAYMDICIMQTAIAEMLSFAEIPVSVTINEYVETAKWYSTPKSAGYVNGIIDAVAKRLKSELKMLKQ